MLKLIEIVGFIAASIHNLTIKLAKQSGDKSERLELAIPNLKKGDVIMVKTRCNEFGNKSGELTIS